MSTEAPTWYVEKYKSDVLFSFQSQGHILKGLTMPPSKIDGKTLYFPVAGKGSAVEMVVGSDLKPMNAGRSNKQVTTKAYQAAEFINQVDLDRMAANEMAVATQQAATALGRVCDKIVVDAVDGGAGSYGTAYGSGAAAWDLKFALAASTGHFNKDIPQDGQSYCMLPHQAFAQMMSYSVFSSSDWVATDLPFTKFARAKQWAGINWFAGPAEHFRATANDVRFYIWHRNAIGSGYNGSELNTKITWENIKTAWLANNWMDMGASVLLPEGITECHYLGTSGITGGTI
ncbi:MAG: phage capsid protein [Hyphomicrobium sp.]